MHARLTPVAFHWDEFVGAATELSRAEVSARQLVRPLPVLASNFTGDIGVATGQTRMLARIEKMAASVTKKPDRDGS
jgi:hypothetical protein